MLDWIIFFGVGLLVMIIWATGSSTEQIKRKKQALIKDEYNKRYKKNKRK